MGRGNFGAVLVALAVATSVAISVGAPVAARTFDVVQQSQSIFQDRDGNGGHITGQTTLWSNGQQRNLTLAAGGFQLMQRESGSNDAYTRFMAFCVELTTSVRTSTTNALVYQDAPDLFDPLRQTLVATLFQEVYDPTGSATHQGAFQLALWKLTHGDVRQPDGDGFDIRDTSTMTNGVLSFTRNGDGTAMTRSFDVATPGVFRLAQGWLDHLDGAGSDWALSGAVSDHVVFLSNGASQNIVTAARYLTPIPVPPAALMSGAGLMALVLLRLRHRQIG